MQGARQRLLLMCERQHLIKLIRKPTAGTERHIVECFRVDYYSETTRGNTHCSLVELQNVAQVSLSVYSLSESM